MAKKTFRESFKEARSNKKKTFMWEGKSYSAETAEEKAKKMSDKDLSSKSNKAYEDAEYGYMKDRTKDENKGKDWESIKYSDKTKSYAEISKSYTKEKLKRRRKNYTKK